MPGAVLHSLRLTLLATGAAAALWGFAQNPLTRPLAERSSESAARAIEAAFHRTFTPAGAEARLRQSLEAGDDLRSLWLADLAAQEGIPLPADLLAQTAAIRDAQSGLWASTRDCAACAVDIQNCTSLTEIAACAVPFEISPLGDLNALRRQGMNVARGEEVDRLDAGLALVGLAATSAVLVTGGGSFVAKAGATALRTARRFGSLTPGLLRTLGDFGDLPIRWSAIRPGAGLDEITDAAKLSRLSALAGDVGRIAGNTSAGDTLMILRHIDGPEDAARLARISEISGAKTASRAEVLGKSRLFRATLRVSDLALSALAAIWAGVTALLSSLAGWIGAKLLRALQPRRRPQRVVPPLTRG